MEIELFFSQSLRARTRRLARGLAVLLAVCSPAAGAQAPAPSRGSGHARAGLLAEARRTFASTCAACHGLDGRGGERGPNLATRPEALSRTDRELLQILRNGAPAAGMPAFASQGEQKLRGLVKYLRSLQGKDSAVAIPGDVRQGESLFFGKARCSECHMAEGRGGFIASDLTVYASGSAAAEIRKAILYRDPEAKQNQSQVVVTFKDGRSLSGMVRNEDNFSLQLQSRNGAFHLLQKSDLAEIKFSAEPLMPANYGQTLSPAELDDLVGYLMNLARRSPYKLPPHRKHEDE